MEEERVDFLVIQNDESFLLNGPDRPRGMYADFSLTDLDDQGWIDLFCEVMHLEFLSVRVQGSTRYLTVG